MLNKTFLMLVSILTELRFFLVSLYVSHLRMALQIKALDGTDHNHPCISTKAERVIACDTGKDKKQMLPFNVNMLQFHVEPI